jgi:hypothetical protein
MCGPLNESSLGCLFFLMYLLYLDDAGSPGNAAEEYFVLGGIAVFEAQTDWFNREIDKIASPFNATNPKTSSSTPPRSSRAATIRGKDWTSMTPGES